MVDDMPKSRASLPAVAVRLSQLMKASGVTVRELQQRLEAKGVEGSKYSNVRRYVAGEGKSPPPLEWIEAAAQVLNARPAWLAFGEGEATEKEERALRARFSNIQKRLGQPGPDHIVVLVGFGQEAVVKPERVVLIDAGTLPHEQRVRYMRSIAAAASEVAPPAK
jgi:hypothetical protein